MPPVAATTVTYDVDNPSAQAVPSATVTARLSTGSGDRNDAATVITGTVTTITDSAGAFSLALVPNSAYRTTGTWYVITIAGGPTYNVVVPVSGTSVNLWDIRVDPATLAPVPAATPSIYLPRAERGAANGVASLGADGLVPAGQLPATGVPTSRLIATQNGLQGGGDLTADRTLSPVYGSTANTVCQGNDARLSDARTPLAHTHPTTDVTGLQTALDGAELHPLSGRGYHSASVELGAVRASSSFAAWVTRIWVPANKAITLVGMVITAAGTLGAGGLNGFAFYTDDGATKLGESLDADTFWAVAGERTVAMAANIAAQATGRFVRCLANVEGYSAGPSVAFAQAQHSAVFNGTATLQRRSAFTSPVSSWPATINPDTLGTPTEFLPLIFLG